MVDRFFCLNIGTDTASLDDTESHHAIHVLRLSPGDAVELFDGTGMMASGEIASITRRTVDVRISERRTIEPAARGRLIVAAAPPKGDRLKSMIEKLTEVGVDEFIPLKTVRSVVDPRQSRLEKLRSTMISAMKQSRRSRFLTISPVTDLSAVLRQAVAERRSLQLAHPGPSSDHLSVPAGRDVLLLIGPEGGFTNEELLQASDHGATRLTWPDGILRIETAALVFSSLLLRALHQTE